MVLTPTEASLLRKLASDYNLETEVTNSFTAHYTTDQKQILWQQHSDKTKWHVTFYKGPESNTESFADLVDAVVYFQKGNL